MGQAVNKSIAWTIFLSVFVLDQITKFLAIRFLSEDSSINIIPGIFDFTLVYNTGAAFGMFSDLPDDIRRFALAGVSLTALAVVVYFMLREAKDDSWSQYALISILSGALGNIVDRERFASVIDFLDFYWELYHWPAFNIADSAICIGVCILIWRMCFNGGNNEVISN